jgi:hypothetical protein
MAKKITSNQLLGEIGEAAVRLRFLNIGFQFDGRSRLEAGVDGIAEVMDKGKPLARMIAVQIKATEAARHSSEDTTGFSYLLRPDDLAGEAQTFRSLSFSTADPMKRISGRKSAAP